MTTALILAGGSGTRMHCEIPKQFLEVHNKPVLIYTMESFEHHPAIDNIEVVCLEDWQKLVWSYAKQYKITKLKWVVPGGNTVQESIRNGVIHLETVCSKDDLTVIHDGIRPLLDAEVLSDVLVEAERHGNAVSAVPCYEQIFETDNQKTTKKYIPREQLRTVVTPQAYRYELLLWAYRTAFEKKIGIYGSSYTNTMLTELGIELHLAAGSRRNIKLTTREDLELFEAYLTMKRGTGDAEDTGTERG